MLEQEVKLAVIVTWLPIERSLGQFRAVHGSYGTMLRNDGGHTYFLLTNKDNQYGSWNGLRPFHFSNTTGDVFMEHNVNIGGNVRTNGRGMKLFTQTFSGLRPAVNDPIKDSNGNTFSANDWVVTIAGTAFITENPSRGMLTRTSILNGIWHFHGDMLRENYRVTFLAIPKKFLRVC